MLHSTIQRYYHCFTYTGTGTSSETCSFKLGFLRRKAMVTSCNQSGRVVHTNPAILRCWQKSEKIHGR